MKPVLELADLFTKEEKIQVGKKVFEACCRSHQIQCVVEGKYGFSFRCGRCVGNIFDYNYYRHKNKNYPNIFSFNLKFKGYSNEVLIQIIYAKENNMFHLKQIRDESYRLYSKYPECFFIPIDENKILYPIGDCLIKSFGLIPKKEKQSDKTIEDLVNSIENAMI